MPRKRKAVVKSEPVETEEAAENVLVPVENKRTRRGGRVKKENVKKEEIKEEPQNLKKIVFSDLVPVDDHCIQCKDNFHVYKEDEDIYNAMLNQTNIGQNNNKYYLLQLLESNSNMENSYVIWFRWGRVGKVAGTTLKTDLNLLEAKKLFEKKFLDKTKNSFDERHDFCKVQGKYDLLQMDYGENNKDIKKKQEELKKKKPKKEVPCKLDVRVKNLMEFLFNVREFEESVKEMQYDVNKAPLGKLTDKQIKAGYASLKKIENCIRQNKKGSVLSAACSEFYTRIPHDFGMKVPPVIRTSEELKKKIELLEALGDIQIALKLMENDEKSKLNIFDAHYDSLGCDIQPLDKSHEECQLINKYVKNSHGSTHQLYTLEIDEVYKINKNECEKSFKKDLDNRLLLWHGSRLTNWCGILRQGLRIAPPEAPVTGYMFGKGVYFADRVSKSANYCYASQRQPHGLMLLSEVALGNMNEKLSCDYDGDKLPIGKHSIKGLGKLIPDEKDDHKMDCGAVMPLGKEVQSGIKDATLYYNEYVVYNVSQIRPKYLLKLKFNFNSWF